MKAIQYRGWTIQLDDYYPQSRGKYICYPTEQGIDHDYDGDSEGFHYCGNCIWADTIEEAKDEIWGKLMASMPQHKVVLHHRPYYFDWIEDAIKFAIKWDAEEFIPATTA